MTRLKNAITDALRQKQATQHHNIRKHDTNIKPIPPTNGSILWEMTSILQQTNQNINGN